MTTSGSEVDPVAGKTIAEILGEIVWLMTQDYDGREMKVSEIERVVMPAILQRRFHIRYAQVPDMRRPGETALQPVAVEIYVAPDPGDKFALTTQVLATFAAKMGSAQ